MRIGHINLARSFNGTGEHFIALVEALDRQRVSQHIIVQNESMAKRLNLYDRVTVGPTTGTAVIAYCLMPTVNLVHAHDERSAHAALLLTLIRSTPFVFTRRLGAAPGGNPVISSIYRRAAAIICTTDSAARAVSRFTRKTKVDIIEDISRTNAANGFELMSSKIAAEHLRVYRQATDTSRVPAFLL